MLASYLPTALYLLMPLTVQVWHSLSLVFQFNLNIKCFVLSLHSIIVPGRLQVTDVANKQFIALEYKYPLWHQYSPLVKMPVIRRPQGTERQSGWEKKVLLWWETWRKSLAVITVDHYSQIGLISPGIILFFINSDRFCNSFADAFRHNTFDFSVNHEK